MSIHTFYFRLVKKDKESDKPLSRAEIADYLEISNVTVIDWMKRGIPCKRMNGRVYFKKEEVMAAMPTFNHRKNSFIKKNASKK